MKYFKNLGFYFLTIIDGVINFLCSVFGLYPTIDSATNFLLVLEMRKVRGVWDDRAKDRQELGEKADKEFAEAKDTLNG